MPVPWSAIEDHHDQIKLFYRIIEEELSVRKAEELARKVEEKDYSPGKTKLFRTGLPQPYEELKNQLADFFHTDIEFRRNGKGQEK